MSRLFQFAKSFFSSFKVKNKSNKGCLSPPVSATTILNKKENKLESKLENKRESKLENKRENKLENKKESKKRKPIPTALREQVWLKHFGKNFEHKCSIVWCTNIISVFNWECGHNIPHSKNGPTILENLIPLCSRCNKSMNDHYTIDEFNLLGKCQNEDDEKSNKQNG